MKVGVKIIGVASMIMLLLGIGTFAYIFSFYMPTPITGRYDCTVAFGAAVWPGGVPSDALKERTERAIDVYRSPQSGPCLIFSGAQSAYGKHEVDAMAELAKKRGVVREDMLLDYNGKNTKQTILNLDKNRSYILVSSNFHLARISLLATQAGLKDFVVLGSDQKNKRFSREPFFVLREVVAFWYYIFVG